MFDTKLIEKFRNTVNRTDFTFFQYRNKRNKNQWNCICSAMDWITVAVDHLNTYPEANVHALNSMVLYSYIASVDILVEAVQQLHRVICSNNKLPFGKDRDCFSNNPFGKADLDYFKSIRAFFGAHPVNLDEPGQEGKKNFRRFASWSGGHFGDKDYSIILYSNQVGEEDIHLSIEMKQIFAFGQKYYDYLRTLNTILKHQQVEFSNRKKRDRFECLGDELSRLHILRDECAKRMDNRLYRSTIDELILIFKTPITCADNMTMVEDYKLALKVLIDEIHRNLQKMILADLKNQYLLTPSSDMLPNGCHYAYGKLYEHVVGIGCPIEIWRNTLQDAFKDVFKFTYKDDSELYVLVQSAIYKLSQKEK